jgi:hypothetical protein
MKTRERATNYFDNAKALNTDAAVLKFGSDHVTLRGAFLEMGVCTGRTINFIAALNPEQHIWGFDSFDGLPEQWNRTILLSLQVLPGLTSRGGCHRFFTM